MARTIFEQEPQSYNKALAEALKKIPEFKAPEWAMFVKSGVSKQRVPSDENFWYIRAASILRQLYLKGVVGVSRLKTRYGSRKNRGGKPARFKKASGKIIRVILQQAEAAGFVEKVLIRQFGRRLTQKGRDFLDSIKSEKPIDRTAELIEVKRLVEKEKEFVQQIGEELEETEEELEDKKGKKKIEKPETEDSKGETENAK